MMGHIKDRWIAVMQPTPQDWGRRWIPASEVLPETRTNVLAYDGNFPHSVTSFRVVSLSIDGSQWFDQHTDEEHPVNAFTHWMPLPQPPEAT
jgi:hypothetical protein